MKLYRPYQLPGLDSSQNDHCQMDSDQDFRLVESTPGYLNATRVFGTVKFWTVRALLVLSMPIVVWMSVDEYFIGDRYQDIEFTNSSPDSVDLYVFFSRPDGVREQYVGANLEPGSSRIFQVNVGNPGFTWLESSLLILVQDESGNRPRISSSAVSAADAAWLNWKIRMFENIKQIPYID